MIHRPVGRLIFAACWPNGIGNLSHCPAFRFFGRDDVVRCPPSLTIPAAITPMIVQCCSSHGATIPTLSLRVLSQLLGAIGSGSLRYHTLGIMAGLRRLFGSSVIKTNGVCTLLSYGPNPAVPHWLIAVMRTMSTSMVLLQSGQMNYCPLDAVVHTPVFAAYRRVDH